jgi:hypothetical protein
MRQKLREEDDHEGRACAGVEVVWRHLQCLSVHWLRQAGQTLDRHTTARGLSAVDLAGKYSVPSMCLSGPFGRVGSIPDSTSNVGSILCLGGDWHDPDLDLASLRQAAAKSCVG